MMVLHYLLYRTQQKQLSLLTRRRSILPLQPPRPLTNVTATVVDRLLKVSSSSSLSRKRSSSSVLPVVVSSSSSSATSNSKSIIFCQSRTPPPIPTTASAIIWNRRFATNEESLNSNTYVSTAATDTSTAAITDTSTAAPTSSTTAVVDDNKNTTNSRIATPPTAQATRNDNLNTTSTVASETCNDTTGTSTSDIVRTSVTAASDSTTSFVTASKEPPPTTKAVLTPPKLRSKSQYFIEMVQTADQLLQRPVGTFVYPDDYNSSFKCIRHICTDVYSDRKQRFDYLHEIDASFFISAINASIHLLERNVEEYSILQKELQNNYTTGTHDDEMNDPTSLVTIFNTKINIKRDAVSLLWFRNEMSINNLFSRWTYLVSMLRPNNTLLIKNMGGNNTKLPELVSAQELIQSLQRMSNSVPSPFRCDITSIQMILKVLIQQVPSKEEAPIIAEQLLSLANINTDNKSSIIPIAQAYEIVMKAWVDSGLPETGSRIDVLLQDFETIGTEIDTIASKNNSVQNSDQQDETAANHMQDDYDVSTRLMPYFIAFRYHIVNKDIKKGLAMLEGNRSNNNNNDDNKRHFNPSTSCEFLSLALYCVIQCHEVQYMGTIFQRLVEAFKTTDQHNSKRYTIQQDFFLVGAGHLLHHYCCQIRMVIENNTYRNIHHQDEDSTATINSYIDRGQCVYQFVEQFCSPFASSHMRISCTMMEVYGYAKRIDLVNDIFHKMVAPNREAHDMLIKAYGNCHLPDRAEEIFKKMFTKESRVKPGIKTINLYMNCWVESMMLSSDDIDKTAALNKVYQTFHWMKTDKQCTDLHILPDTYTYFVLLRGEVASATTASKLSISTCGGNIDGHQINSNIVDKVGEILKEMEDRCKSGDHLCKPNVPIYNCAMKALLLANDYLRAEQILHRMEESIYRNNDDALPNATTAATTCDDVLNARMPAILRPTIHIYILFFNFYLKMRSTDGATRSEQLHNHMRNLSVEMADEEIKPNSITYNKVLDAFVASGDQNVTTDLWRIYEQMSKVDNITIEHDTYMILIKTISKSNRDQDKKRLMELLQHMNDHPTADMDGSLHVIALENCMSNGDVTTTTQIMKAIVDSYVQGHFTIVPPDRSTFNWILTTYLASNDLKSATLFVQDIVQMRNRSKLDTSGNELDVSWIGPDFSMILDLRKAWDEDTKHADKQHYISKLDMELIPSMV